MPDDAPAEGNWGRWGEDDERGALNVLEPRFVREAAARLRTGRTYQLGINIQAEGVPLLGHRGKPMRLTLQDPTDEGIFAAFGCEPGTGANEDVLVLASHTTSHMDALAHVYEGFRHYNGFPSTQMQAMAGATKLGIEKAGGFAARAVLLDIPRQLGEPWMEPGRVVTPEDLDTAAKSQGVEIRPGDVVLLRTGYLDMWFDRKGKLGYEQPGLGLDGARWLAERDVVAIGADNAAVEAVPFDREDFLGVHKLLLVHYGVYIIEFLDLSAPARDECFEGLITVAPLKMTGATGSPVNPILIG